MKLIVLSDSSSDSEKGSRSRCGAIGVLGSDNMSIVNEPILTTTSIIPGVPNSAAEAETAGNYAGSTTLKYARKVLARCDTTTK